MNPGELVASHQSARRRPAAAGKYEYGHIKLCARGLLLVGVSTSGVIVSVRYFFVSYTRLRPIINFDYFKIAFEIGRRVSSNVLFPVFSEGIYTSCVNMVYALN